MIDRRTLLAASGSAAMLVATGARAQAFPARAITLYCAFPAGGPTDQVFRALAEVAARELKQPVVVENRPGAGGTLAAVALTFGIVVPTGAPWKTLREFVDDARRNPGKIDYGSTGTGTTPHLAVEEFAARAGIKLTHVPFKGSSDLMAAILGGHIQAASDSTGWAPHVDSGKLRLLATFGSKRTRKWPEVPTLAELGYDTISDSPFGLAGPAGIDAAVLRTLHDAFRKALDEPRVRELLDRYDQPVIYMGPDEYARWARQTWEAERGTIERLGLKGSM
ncbi:MAG: tripartite tricarboxylate transporter substrate binding protein [Burkholderiaceae bacterium]|nr:tripartite tricarboxylate transporter substrate binding protein [Burkholderiaceae bacterium]